MDGFGEEIVVDEGVGVGRAVVARGAGGGVEPGVADDAVGAGVNTGEERDRVGVRDGGEADDGVFPARAVADEAVADVGELAAVEESVEGVFAESVGEKDVDVAVRAPDFGRDVEAEFARGAASGEEEQEDAR
jgi:hypothetical protein